MTKKTKQEYMSMTMNELREICRNKAIVMGRLKKNELVNKIIHIQNQSDADKPNEPQNINKRKRKNIINETKVLPHKKRKITTNQLDEINVSKWLNMNNWTEYKLQKLPNIDVRKLCGVCGITKEANKTELIKMLVQIHGDKEKIEKIKQKHASDKKRRNKHKKKHNTKSNKNKTSDKEEADSTQEETTPSTSNVEQTPTTAGLNLHESSGIVNDDCIKTLIIK